MAGKAAPAGKAGQAGEDTARAHPAQMRPARMAQPAGAKARARIARHSSSRTSRPPSMKEFKDKVAVVTGGASGLGLAMARRFAAEGMKLVLADIEEEALRKVETDFRKAGVPVIGIWTDVSRAQDIERLAEKTLATFGAVHVLCNNAGVAPGGRVWEHT